MSKKNIRTPYSKTTQVDITSLLNTNLSTTINNQIGGVKKSKNTQKKHKKNNQNDSDIESSQYGSGSDTEDEENEENEENEEIEEIEEIKKIKKKDKKKIKIKNENIDIDDNENNEEEQDEDEIEEADEEEEDEDEEEEEKEEIEKEDLENDDSDKETVNNNKCYSKFAKTKNDFDFEEYFKDDDITITKKGRVGKPILFKYEQVRLLSDRSRQLAEGAKPMIKNTTGLTHKEIALLELKNKIMPLIIERPIPNAGTERWHLSELDIPDYD
jgi:DNA-directed RNA polymerase subunit K/omega